jgi:hypothetical protein
MIAADLADVTALRAIVKDVDYLDALIHCAGVSAMASVVDTDLRQGPPQSGCEASEWLSGDPTSPPAAYNQSASPR